MTLVIVGGSEPQLDEAVGVFIDSGFQLARWLSAWDQADALTRDHDLTHTIVFGNLLPATQGQRFTESFVVGTALPAAIARFGSAI